MRMAASRVTRMVGLAALVCVPARLTFGQAEGVSGRSFGPPIQSGPTGSVSGTVIDQDTQRPVRLASVSLQPIQAAGQNNGQRSFAGGGFGGSSRRTGLDGTFLIEGVAPGDYYVTASLAGYVSERALLQAQVAAGESVDDAVRQVPAVHVSANGTANVVVNVQHGGAISGRVQWEDGSAANGVQMTAVAATTTTQPGATASASTSNSIQGLPTLYGGGNFSRDSTVDDRGNFRVAGLAAGEYIVSATITPEYSRGGPTSAIRVYAPGVFRRAEATPVAVRAGDERGDVRMVIRLNGLRTVSGNVGAASGSESVHSGSVSLVDSVDTSLRLSGRIASDGSFSVKYVPPGTYTMTVQGSSQEAQSGYRRGGSSSSTGDAATTFATLTQPLQVGSTDVSGMAVNLAVAASK